MYSGFQVNARKEEFPNNKDGLHDAVAAVLLTMPVFAAQAAAGATVTGKKVREKFGNMLKTAKDAEKKAKFLSGVRSGEQRYDIECQLDEAIAHDSQIQEDRDHLRAGAAATTAWQQQRGSMVGGAGAI